jgi:hypothetical protein
MSMDTQQIGIIGKHILIASLIAGEIEVAEPLRDHGIDLIAFRDRANGLGFLACPIQLKTATEAVFGLEKKYKNFRGLRIVYIWSSKRPEQAQIFALTYQEALDVLVKMKYARTNSWKRGKYTTTKPSKKLKKMLEQFRVKAPPEWPERLGLLGPGASLR